MTTEEKMIQSCLKLFKAFPILNKNISYAIKNNDILRQLVNLDYGIVLNPRILNDYTEDDISKYLKATFFNINNLNNTFHKSWEKIKNSSEEDLLTEQILHYFSTYGLEALGLYNDDYIYIPSEKLNVPDIKTKDFRFVFINYLSEKEVLDKLKNLLCSGIALKEEVLNDINNIITYINIDENFLF